MSLVLICHQSESTLFAGGPIAADKSNRMKKLLIKVILLYCFSQYGTIVDGKRLGFELPRLEKVNGDMSSLDAFSCPAEAIRDFMRLRKGVSLSLEMFHLKNSKHNSSHSVHCFCDGMFVSGWEGSSVVNHGSFISIGCFDFVFVVL